MNAQRQSNYQTTCDPVTGICTAKLKVSRGRAYPIGKERMSPQFAERLAHLRSVDKTKEVREVKPAEYLGLGFNLEIREIDKDKRVVPFIASTASVDRYGDIIQQEGWQLDNYKKNPIVLFAHDSHSLPIGKAIQVGKMNGSLFVLLEFMTEDIYPLADQVFKMLCGGFLNTLSVGFIPLEYSYRFEETAEDEDPNPWPVGAIYEKCELLENSVVPVPANPEALVVGRTYKMNGRSVISEAFERTEVEEFKNRKTGDGELMWAHKSSERSFFVLGKNSVYPHGSINPADTKVVNADPYLLVSGNKFYSTIKAGSEANAVSRSIERLNEYANLNLEEAFLCEVIGSNDEQQPVYRSLFLISKETPHTTMSCKCKSHGECEDCKAKAANKEQKAIELQQKEDAAVDKKFSKQSANNKVQKAATAVKRAHREVTECHDEYCSMLGGLCEDMDAMAEECMKSVEGASSKIGDGTLKDRIENCFEQSKEIKREMIRSVNRFRGHMNRAIEHMKSVCDFAESEEDPEVDDPEEDDQPNDKPAKVNDGESTSEKPNADAEAAAGSNVEDDFLAEVNRLATNSDEKASNGLDRELAGAPPVVQVGSASNAQVDAEFEALLTDLNK
jgi:HK97 family phage prohead protease